MAHYSKNGALADDRLLGVLTRVILFVALYQVNVTDTLTFVYFVPKANFVTLRLNFVTRAIYPCNYIPQS